MKTSYTKIAALLFAALLFCPGNMSAQQKEKSIIIESSVKDENGAPIANAEVFSGNAYARTDADGKFTISAPAGKAQLIIEAEGYDTLAMAIDEAANESEFSLKASTYLYSENDKVNLAFHNAYAGDVVSAYTKIDMAEKNKYDHQLWGSDVLTGRAQGILGSNNVRGIGTGIDVGDATDTGNSISGTGNALFVVDGLPRDIVSLRADEIESITVLKDINASILYGAQAVNGVVLITTKRGAAHKNSATFSANYGLSTALDKPKYLNSADYMEAYNTNRAMDGLAAQYSADEISKYRSGNKYRYPDNDYYSDDNLKSMKNYFDLQGVFEGGSETAQYYATVGWYSQGSILDFGEWKNARNNIFNVRANVDLKINDWIKMAMDGTALFGQNNTGRGDYWGTAATERPFEYSPLLPISLVSGEEAQATANASKYIIDGAYILGGNTNYTTNRFADGLAGGTFSRVTRKFSFNNRLDFDLSQITEGLSFHTNMNFDFYNAFDQTVYNTYSVYQPTWSADDKITALKQIGTDSRPGTQAVGNTTFRRRMGFFAQLGYDRTFDDVHHFMGNLVGYHTQLKIQGTYQPVKTSHLGLQLNYTYDKKYTVDFSGNYASSPKLAEGHRTGVSPSAALGWVLSRESFLKDVEWLDHLKLRVSAGVLKSDIPVTSFYLYEPAYTTSTTIRWGEGSYNRASYLPSRGANYELTFADRKELNVGLEGAFFNKSLTVDANLFWEKYNGQVVRPTAAYPGFYSAFVAYENFNEDSYRGFDVGVKYKKNFGDFRFMVGATALYVDSERKVVDESYAEPYMYRAGHPRDAYFGYMCEGIFQSQAEIDGHAKQTLGTVKPGDLKYKDLNNDGVIDTNDQTYLGRWNAPLSGGLELNLGYKNWDLYVLGEAQFGGKGFKENSYYWIDSTDKYSEIALNSWTESNKSAEYPRITTQAGNNNLVRSTFWLYDKDYFQIRKIQLTYQMPDKIANAVLMKKMSVYLDATTPFRFASNREVLDLKIGSEMSYRTFSIGFKSTF